MILSHTSRYLNGYRGVYCQMKGNTMRESQFIDDYLDTTENPKTRYTVGTYLAYQLSGKAALFSDVYARSLMRAIQWRIDRGEVKKVPSVKGGESYIRTPNKEIRYAEENTETSVAVVNPI